MSRSLILSNGSIFVGLNQDGFVSDFFYPYVGVENHVRGTAHKIGVFIDGQMSWLNDGNWQKTITLQKDTFIGDIRYVHTYFGIELLFTDAIYNEKNVFFRKVTVINHRETECSLRLFFHQAFSIYGTTQEDTVYFDPTKNAIIQYEGRRVFLTYAETSGTPFDDYSVGLYGIEGKEGTYNDAEDGVLSKNPIEHGHVDSVIALSLQPHKSETKIVTYWTAVGETKNEVYDLHDFILYKGAEHLMESTAKFWYAWLMRQEKDYCDGLGEAHEDTFKKSLFYIRGNIDNRGAVIASGDSDMLQGGRDTYSYMWPRDGAMTAMALLMVGEYNTAKHFFKFCNDVLEDKGYLMHKYRSDRSLGSSWHAFIKDGKPILPIQEDESALYLIALLEYYQKTKDIDFIENHYHDVIQKMANFLVDFRDAETGLPLPSYDLWEEKHGVSTFTACTVYRGLMAAAFFAQLFGKENNEHPFRTTAEKMRDAILKHLYDDDLGMFIKMRNVHQGKIVLDKTLDMSSIYGIYAYGILDPDDKRVTKSIKTLEEKLLLSTGIGGMPRYESDRYYMKVEGTPNPWYITTLWLAQYYTRIAKNENDLAKVRYWLDWVITHSPLSRTLSEQLHPFSGEQLSASPLTWSHAEYVRTVVMYHEAKLRTQKN